MSRYKLRYTAEKLCCLLVIALLSFGCSEIQNFSLANAVVEDNVDKARKLLEKGADANHRDEETGSTLLQYAAKAISVNALELLLNKGADVNAKGFQDITALHLAVYAASKANIGALVDDETHSTSRFVQKYNDAKKAVRLLIENGADVDAKAFEGKTPLLFAIHEISPDVADLLISNGADIEVARYSGLTALTLSILTGNSDMATFLIDKGADVNARTDWGATPIHTAVYKRDKAVVKKLLNYDAEISTATYYVGLKPVHIASRRGNKELIDLLLDISDYSSLRSAVIRGDLDAVHKALGERCDVNEDDNHGYAPLHDAVLIRNREITNLLIDSGADIGHKDKLGYQVLHSIAFEGDFNLEMVKLLIERGADVNAKGNNDNTPLHFSADRGHKEIAEFLIDSGANVDAKNSLGKTALMLAQEREKELEVLKEIVQLLKAKVSKSRESLQTEADVSHR